MADPADDVEDGVSDSQLEMSDEEEDRGDHGEEAAAVLLAGDARHQVVERLDDGFHEVLDAAGHQLHLRVVMKTSRCRIDDDDHPGGDHRVGDLDAADFGQRLGGDGDMGSRPAQEYEPYEEEDQDPEDYETGLSSALVFASSTFADCFHQQEIPAPEGQEQPAEQPDQREDRLRVEPAVDEQLPRQLRRQLTGRNTIPVPSVSSPAEASAS